MARRVEARLRRSTVNLPEGTTAAIAAVAERHDLAAGVVARLAIEAGLPLVRTRLRKNRRTTGGAEGGAEGGQAPSPGSRAPA